MVGHTAICVKDISYRLKTEQAYENLGATEEVAIISLINDIIEHEVASLIPLLEKLQTGLIYRSIAEDDYSYKVIRVKERKDKQYQVETITVYKRPFDEWFKKEAEKIKIEILDSEFKKSIQIRYPNLWWTPNLSP